LNLGWKIGMLVGFLLSFVALTCLRLGMTTKTSQQKARTLALYGMNL
jgi:hypothetical protein